MIKVILVHDFSWPYAPSTTSLRRFHSYPCIVANYSSDCFCLVPDVWTSFNNIALTINLVNDSTMYIRASEYSCFIHRYRHEKIIFGPWRRTLSLSYRNHAEYVREFFYLRYFFSVTYRLVVTFTCVIFREDLLASIVEALLNFSSTNAWTVNSRFLILFACIRDKFRLVINVYQRKDWRLTS